MYKTSIITDEVSQDLKVAAELAVRYKLDAVEIRSVNERNPFQMDRQDFRSIKEIVDSYGLHVCAIGSPLFKCDLDDEAACEQHLEGLKRCVEAAHLWNTRLIRAFTFWSKKGQTPCWGRIEEKMRQAIAIAEDGGVCLAIESEPSVNTGNIKTLVDFLKAIDSPSLGAMWDPGNEIADPLAPPPYPDGYRLIKPFIKHVHLKDLKHTDSGEFLCPALLGEGDVDFMGLLRQLKLDGYDGYVSVETHYRLKPQQMDDALLMQPQGSSFSEGGYEASVVYLDRLRDMYHWQEEA